MKLGAEPKKMAALGALMLVLGYVVWDNLLSSPTPVAAPVTPNIAAAPQPGVAIPQTASAERPGANVTRGRNRRAGAEQFVPSLLPKRGPNGEIMRPDPLKVDPQLKLDILAKLATVNYTGTGRNLFEMGVAPPPKPTTPDPKIIPGVAKPVIEPMRYAMAIGPPKDPPPPPPPPPPPQPPPITMKFYGYSGPRGAGKKAFFLDGEEIHMAGEGDMIKNRWKVVRIGLSSADVQDTQFPQARPQQVPLSEEPPSA
jgi:hypothetical protein